MCCFSRPVVSVSDTKIFVRPQDKGRQFLVYNMSIEARSELAMILPLPADESDVEFINSCIKLRMHGLLANRDTFLTVET